MGIGSRQEPWSDLPGRMLEDDVANNQVTTGHYLMVKVIDEESCSHFSRKRIVLKKLSEPDLDK